VEQHFKMKKFCLFIAFGMGGFSLIAPLTISNSLAQTMDREMSTNVPAQNLLLNGRVPTYKDGTINGSIPTYQERDALNIPSRTYDPFDYDTDYYSGNRVDQGYYDNDAFDAPGTDTMYDNDGVYQTDSVTIVSDTPIIRGQDD
jgi:hypothetical protein